MKLILLATICSFALIGNVWAADAAKPTAPVPPVAAKPIDPLGAPPVANGNAPTGPTRFAEIPEAEGKWSVMASPSFGFGNAQCSAYFESKTGPAAINNGLTINFMRSHAATTTGSPNDNLMISLSSFGTSQKAVQGLFIDEKDSGFPANGGAASRNASIQITDLKALEQKIKSGKNFAFKLDEQQKTMSPAVLSELVEKLNDCVEKAVKEQPKK